MEKTPNLKGFTFGRKLKNPKKCQKIAKDLRFLYIREPENPKIEGKIFSPPPFYLRGEAAKQQERGRFIYTTGTIGCLVAFGVAGGLLVVGVFWGSWVVIN